MARMESVSSWSTSAAASRSWARTMGVGSIRNASRSPAIARLMALQARLLDGSGRGRAFRPVRIVTGGAGKRITLLKALALAQVVGLVGDVIVLGVLGRQRLVRGVQRLPRPVSERRGAI